MKLSVELTPQQEQQLAALAERLQVAPEALAAAALRDLLEQRSAEFERAATRVLEKNAELYRRLA
ncbi:MAG: DNA-binding protein [Actinobacteria bacterium]|jgi:predicted transcriptional regulator|nr:DNA-binding protein [Actinomycetota bacterium]